MSFTPESIRQYFPLLQSRTYLNSCSYGVLCDRVEQAFHEYLQSRQAHGSNWEAWVMQLETLRAALGRLLQADPNDIGISSCLSESVNALASSIDLSQQRDTVVVTDFDFPTSSQIWLSQQRRGGRILRAHADKSGTRIPLSEFERLIDDRTAIVSIPYVCYRNGVKLDFQPVVELAHERGALVLLDAYQAIGSVVLDAPGTGADFIAGGCLKYLLGTAGIGFMYVRNSESQERIPTSTGWFAQENPNAMDIYHNAPSRTARRFQSGTPNVCATYACTAGIEMLLETGLEAAEAQIAHLTSRIARACEENGWNLVTPADPQGHGALMAIASTDAPRLVSELDQEGIVVSDRDGNLRVSPHYYNNDSDIDHLVTELQKRPALLGI